MCDHFNGLSPAEAELLAMLAEECGEVIQVVGKILRHGFESCHPDDLNPITGDRYPSAKDNRELLTEELADVYAVADLMGAEFAIIDAAEHEDRIEKKLRYTHHQGFGNAHEVSGNE